MRNQAAKFHLTSPPPPAPLQNCHTSSAFGPLTSTLDMRVHPSPSIGRYLLTNCGIWSAGSSCRPNSSDGYSRICSSEEEYCLFHAASCAYDLAVAPQRLATLTTIHALPSRVENGILLPSILTPLSSCRLLPAAEAKVGANMPATLHDLTSTRRSIQKPSLKSIHQIHLSEISSDVIG